jgi:hypothetical protein
MPCRPHNYVSTRQKKNGLFSNSRCQESLLGGRIQTCCNLPWLVRQPERDRDRSQVCDKDCSEMLHSSTPQSKKTADPNRRCARYLALNQNETQSPLRGPKHSTLPNRQLENGEHKLFVCWNRHGLGLGEKLNTVSPARPPRPFMQIAVA